MGKILKVCIDCGHYGKYNRSAEVPAYYESEFAWTMGLALKKEFEKYNCIVLMTRTNINNDLALLNRGEMSKGYDIFISVHANASTSNKTDYVAIFYGHNQPTTN